LIAFFEPPWRRPFMVILAGASHLLTVKLSGICQLGYTHEDESPMVTRKSKASPHASGLVQDVDWPNRWPNTPTWSRRQETPCKP
jgi:hypothetical protein